MRRSIGSPGSAAAKTRQEGLQGPFRGGVGARHLGGGLRGSCAVLGLRIAGVGLPGSGIGYQGVKIGGQRCADREVGQLGQRWDRAFLSAVPATTRAVIGFQRYWDRGTDVFT